MFNFLSSLFSPSTKRSPGVDDDLIKIAMDRVIEGTDKRLLGLGNYRRQLQEPVEKAVVHVINLIDALPEPVEISHSTFSSDQSLHAFFASFDHMQEKVGAAKTVEAYLKKAPIGDNSRIYKIKGSDSLIYLLSKIKGSDSLIYLLSVKECPHFFHNEFVNY